MIGKSIYVCPVCRGALTPEQSGLRCSACTQVYKENRGVLCLLPPGCLERESTVLKRAYSKFFDLVAPIYESDLWYQLTLNLSGAGQNSITSIAEFLRSILKDIDGNVLDVACGPATYGRRLVSDKRTIYGIDLSAGMLRQGLRFLAKEKNPAVFLAQATAAQLPFPADAFDGALCAGSLHLFDNPAVVLKEIARTLKNGSPLALQTFTAKAEKTQPSFKEKTGFHLFGVQELENLLHESGFRNIAIQQSGTILLSGSRRK